MIDGEEEQQGDGGKKVAEEVSECCQDHCGPPWTTVDHCGPPWSGRQRAHDRDLLRAHTFTKG